MISEKKPIFSTPRDALLNKSQRTDEDQSMTIEMKQLSLGNQQETIRSRIHSISARQDLYLRRGRRTVSRIQILETKPQPKVQDQDGFTVQNGVDEVKFLLAGEEDTKKKAVERTYDMWDLTYTLIRAKVPIGVVTFLFLLFVLIRYYTFACLIYMAAHSDRQDIWWVMVIIADRLLYMLLVMKISLQTPETRTQIVLKSHWNSKQSSISQYFEVVDAKKLITSLIRGLIPAQLAFIYIRAPSRRRFQLYTAINYINASIEAIIYYPFFVIYCYLLTSDNTFALNKYYQGATIGFAVIAEIMMITASVILIVIGARKKYQKNNSSS